jgi:hypothetical protein
MVFDHLSRGYVRAAAPRAALLSEQSRCVSRLLCSPSNLTVCRGCSAHRAVSLCVAAALLSEQSHCVSRLLCSPSSLTVCRGCSALRAVSLWVGLLCSPSSLTVCRGCSALRAVSSRVVAALLLSCRPESAPRMTVEAGGILLFTADFLLVTLFFVLLQC